jgi:hypothetical protein
MAVPRAMVSQDCARIPARTRAIAPAAPCMLRAMPCTEIATAHTMAFLARHLPPVPARVLEVGCGRGEVLAARWVAEHEPHHGHAPLHTGASMAHAIAARFTVLATERVPCLYRTVVQHSDDARLGAAFLELEERRIASGHLRPLGLRIVAQR